MVGYLSGPQSVCLCRGFHFARSEASLAREVGLAFAGRYMVAYASGLESPANWGHFRAVK